MELLFGIIKDSKHTFLSVTCHRRKADYYSPREDCMAQAYEAALGSIHHIFSFQRQESRYNYDLNYLYFAHILIMIMYNVLKNSEFHILRI